LSAYLRDLNDAIIVYLLSCAPQIQYLLSIFATLDVSFYCIKESIHLPHDLVRDIVFQCRKEQHQWLNLLFEIRKFACGFSENFKNMGYFC
jgi:hypothetical protein